MPDILLRDLSFRYGKKTILDGYSLTLHGPGIHTLTGPSGCGKTTLLRLILGLQKPTSGSVSVSEKPVAAFQEYRLFPWLDAAENVAIARSTRNSREMLDEAMDLLRSFGFSDSEMHAYPDQLSGGMKQRISICRALFSESNLLLFDEPTKELDQALRETVCAAFRRRAENSLILLTTHRMEEIELLGAVDHSFPVL